MKRKSILLMSIALLAGTLAGCGNVDNSASPSMPGSTPESTPSASVGSTPSASTPETSTPEEKVITSIEMGVYPKTEYEVGDEFDITGLTIVICYSDDTEDEIPGTIEMISKVPDMNKSGPFTVVISYENFETEYDINIKSKIVKTTPTITFTIENGAKFYADEAPVIDVLVEPFDVDYITHFSNGEDNLGDTMPTTPGRYSFVCEVLESEKYLSTSAWVNFEILERSNKTTPTFTFTYEKDGDQVALESGTHFVEGNVPTLTAVANEDGVQVEVYYTKDDGETNLGSDAPTIPGTYAINIKSIEDDNYSSVHEFRWYVIDKAPEVGQTSVHLVADEVVFTYDGHAHSPIWHFEDDENNRVDNVQFTFRYSSDDGYDSEEAPTEPGWYSLSIYITDETHLMSGNHWIVFRIDEAKMTPSVYFTIENGEVIKVGLNRVVDVLVEPENIVYHTYFEKDEVNIGTEMPTEPGTYSFICETEANDEYVATRSFRWFIISAESE